MMDKEPRGSCAAAAAAVMLRSVLAAGASLVSSGVPFTEEEAAEEAKRHIDDAVATVAEMQLTEEQLKVIDCFVYAPLCGHYSCSPLQ